jgi:hypothetical protein
VGLQIGIHVAHLIERLIGHPLEGLVHAFGGLPGRGEELYAGAVGLLLLGAHVTEHRILDRHRGPGQGGHAGLPEVCAATAAGGNQRAGAEEHGDDRLRRRGGDRLAHARQMSAGDVAALVRQHADDLIRRLGLHQCATVDEDAAAVGDEGIERTIVDDDDLHVLLGKPRRPQDRLRVFSEQLLDFRVADDGRSLLLRAGGSAGAGEGGGGHEGDETRRWRRSPRPDRSFGSGHVRWAWHRFPRNLLVRRRAVNAVTIRV